MESTDVAGGTEEWDVVAGKIGLLLQVACQIAVEDLPSGNILSAVTLEIWGQKSLSF